jgi:hypothetical protein
MTKWEWDEDYEPEDVIACPNCDAELDVEEHFDLSEALDGDQHTVLCEVCSKEVHISISKPTTLSVYMPAKDNRG